jgi:hypothetical protein
MATTTGGTTYVTSTDLVADYPTASLALANRVDVVASGGPNSIKTSGYTITLADILGGNKFLYNSASPGTFTLPTSSLVDGMVVNVAQIGAGALTVSGGTIVGTTVTTAQYQSLQFVYASTGTTWYSVAPPSAAPGLSIVSPTSIANSGGSASASGGQVSFTGVSSISLNGVFTSTYDNYRVTMRISGTSTSDAFMRTRVRVGGVDNSTASSYYQTSLYSGGSSASGNSGIQDNMLAGITNSTYATSGSWIYDYISPALASQTLINAHTFYTLTAGARYLEMVDCYHNATTAFDGFTMYPSTGTITGNIRVYGYKNS